MSKIDKDALIAKIKRLRKHYEEGVKEFGDAGYKDNVLLEQAKQQTCEKILALINSLPDDPANEDLEEAAKKKARCIFESLEKHNVGEEKNRVLFGLLELEALALTFSHFGAEWMAGQGEFIRKNTILEFLQDELTDALKSKIDD